MKVYRYSCDGGSIMIGNEDFACHYMNNYGDGKHRVYVFEKGEMAKRYRNVNAVWEFAGSVLGKANLYDYDCYDKNERANKDNVLCELNGRYGVYSTKYSGDMAIEYWDDYKC